MTKKELSQLYYLKKEIRQLERRIKELETAAMDCTAKITGLPHGTGVNDKIGNYTAQIADLKSLLDLNLKKCFYELNRLDRYIQSVDDPLLRQIMTYRFINCYSWSKISYAVGGNNTPDGLRIKMMRFLKKS
ncbi:MAG: hypothetical protein ACLSDH_05380 [Bacilli bacterium]